MMSANEDSTELLEVAAGVMNPEFALKRLVEILDIIQPKILVLILVLILHWLYAHNRFIVYTDYSIHT